MQGARIFRNEAYFKYVGMTKEEAQHSRWTFYEAVNALFFPPIQPNKLNEATASEIFFPVILLFLCDFY